MPQEEPANAAAPETSEDYFRQGWIQHSYEKDESAAEESFRRSISLDRENVDAYYGLGLILKATARNKEAVDTFQIVIDKIGSGGIEDRVRSEMLRRLTLAHINLLNSGDWGLEDEIWQHKE